MELHSALQGFYENYDEDNRLNTRYGRVEFITNIIYIQKYLKPGMRLLEIGAATGKYSHYFARQGYRVDAVELLDHNIEIFKQNTQPGEAITVAQGNACDLSAFPNNTYDITLLFGPMYHLFDEESKRQALSEAIRVTKSGGVVFVAYCGNEATILQYCILRGMFSEERYRRLVNMETFKAQSDPAELFELHRPEEIEELRNVFDVTPLHMVASDGFANYIREPLIHMDEAIYHIYLQYHLATCERHDMIGYANHILDVFRKN